MKTCATLDTKIIDLSDVKNGANYDEYLFNKYDATAGYNFNYFDGKLTNALGLQSLSVRVNSTSANVKTLSLSMASKIMSYSSVVLNKMSVVIMDLSYNLYKNDIDSFSSDFTKITQFDSEPNIIRLSTLNENYIVFSTANKFYIYSGGYGVKTLDSDVKLLDVCVHNGSMFVVKDHEVRHTVNWFSDINPDNIVTNLKSANLISVPDTCGNIVKIISFNDYLYVFCEYGIFRLVSYESKKKQYVEPVFVGSARIFPNTIVLAGGNIIFTCEDGIYNFTGLKVNKYDVKITSLLKGVDNSYAKAVFGNGKYYLTCKLNYEDGKIVGAEGGMCPNNTLVELDSNLEKVVLNRGICLQDLSTLFGYENHKVMCIAKQYSPTVKELCESGEYDDDYPLKKKWQYAKFDLGKPETMKVVKRMYVKTLSDIAITFECDDKIKTVNVKGSNIVQNIPINLKGKVLGVMVECEKAVVKIETIKLLVGVYD